MERLYHLIFSAYVCECEGKNYAIFDSREGFSQIGTITSDEDDAFIKYGRFFSKVTYGFDPVRFLDKDSKMGGVLVVPDWLEQKNSYTLYDVASPKAKFPQLTSDLQCMENSG